LNRIRQDEGFIFYHGIEKYDSRKGHDAKALYKVTLTKSMRKINEAVSRLHGTFSLMMDGHENRAEHVEAASKTMYGADSLVCLIEPPIQAESHLYQTLQCADWVCGLVGRLGACRVRPDEYPEYYCVENYFGSRIDGLARFSSIQRKRPASPGRFPSVSLETAQTALAMAFRKALSAKDQEMI
jgi:hypothetical protein